MFCCPCARLLTPRWLWWECGDWWPTETWERVTGNQAGARGRPGERRTEETPRGEGGGGGGHSPGVMSTLSRHRGCHPHTGTAEGRWGSSSLRNQNVLLKLILIGTRPVIANHHAVDIQTYDQSTKFYVPYTLILLLLLNCLIIFKCDSISTNDHVCLLTF